MPVQIAWAFLITLEGIYLTQLQLPTCMQIDSVSASIYMEQSKQAMYIEDSFVSEISLGLTHRFSCGTGRSFEAHSGSLWAAYSSLDSGVPTTAIGVSKSHSN